MPKQFIADLKPGEPIDSDFMIVEASLRTARNGSNYLAMKLSDKSGTIPARLWDAPEALAASMAPDDFVRVKGKAESYRNELQIVIRAVTQADASALRLGDFLPQSSADPAAMMKELREIMATIEDPDYRAAADAFLNDEEFRARFRTAPAAKANHHSYLGGLLEHTLSMAKLALRILDHYPDLRRDILLAGVLFHDIGKIEELAYSRTFRYTTPGNLVGHIVLGVLMLENRVRELPDFPEEKLNMLRHMILSHHGQLEFGAPKLPVFAEAIALHYIDNIDAKLKDFAEFVAEDRSADPEWTERSWLFERQLYKG